MKRPGPREKREEIELIALIELPTAVVAYVVETALVTNPSETAINPLLQMLGFVESP